MYFKKNCKKFKPKIIKKKKGIPKKQKKPTT